MPRLSFRIGFLPLLLVLYLSIRLPGLRSLPVFGDEAMLLRLAVLAREDPVGNAFDSLTELKPPFHVWLLALFLPLSGDPVVSGRLLSVAAGALTLPLFFRLCRELRVFRGDSRVSPAESRWRFAAPVVCVLTLAIPLLAIYQRMALAEALFAAETALAAVLSLRLAAAIRDEAGRRPAHAPSGSLRLALLFGLLLGVSMLTRQVFSYLFPLLPALSLLFISRRGETGKLLEEWKKLAGRLLVSLALGLAVWIPILLVGVGPDTGTRLFNWPGFREPMGAGERGALALKNFGEVFQWLWIYLTPPIALLALLSLLWLFLARQVRVAGFLSCWVALILAPSVLFGKILFPRYIVPVTIPLLLSSALALSAALDRTFSLSVPPSRKAALALLAAAALLAWPAHDLFLQVSDWRRQRLAPVDRWQLVSGWPAGFATERAVAYLNRLGATEEIAVITTPDSGNPPDTVWLLAGRKSGFALYSEISFPEQTSAGLGRKGPDALFLRDDPRRGRPSRIVKFRESQTVLHLSRDRLYTLQGLVDAESHAAFLFGGKPREVARFENPAMGVEGYETGGIVIHKLR